MVSVRWSITRWRVAYPSSRSHAVQALGAVVIVLGLEPIVATFVSFVRAGGTPIPGALTQKLVVHGLNRYMRPDLSWRPGDHRR